MPNDVHKKTRRTGMINTFHGWANGVKETDNCSSLIQQRVTLMEAQRKTEGGTGGGKAAVTDLHCLSYIAWWPQNRCDQNRKKIQRPVRIYWFIEIAFHQDWNIFAFVHNKTSLLIMHNPYGSPMTFVKVMQTRLVGTIKNALTSFLDGLEKTMQRN